MTRAFALAVVALFAAPSASTPPPLPFLPSVARVHLDVTRDHVVVVTDVDLPRGEWKGGDLDLFVAFGAPGAPEAFDARVFAVPDGALDPDPHDEGSPAPFDLAPVRPKTAHALLGSPQMSGAVVHVDAASFRRATAPGGMAVLRVRSLLPIPAIDAAGGREIVARLGAASGAPLTLGRVQIASNDPSAPIARADARLCGPDADPWPLAITIAPRPPPRALAPAPIAPVLAVRHASDDLCVRFFAP